MWVFASKRSSLRCRGFAHPSSPSRELSAPPWVCPACAPACAPGPRRSQGSAWPAWQPGPLAGRLDVRGAPSSLPRRCISSVAHTGLWLGRLPPHGPEVLALLSPVCPPASRGVPSQSPRMVTTVFFRGPHRWAGAARVPHPSWAGCDPHMDVWASCAVRVGRGSGGVWSREGHGCGRVLFGGFADHGENCRCLEGVGLGYCHFRGDPLPCHCCLRRGAVGVGACDFPALAVGTAVLSRLTGRPVAAEVLRR